MKKPLRKLEIVIISDIHLGTYGCHAHELLNYLNTIKPKILILNGDIIDIWQFNKWYWPKSHMKIIKKIISFASKKTKVYYLAGNHDELFRKFLPIRMGNLQILNKKILNINGKKLWVFHGDLYDYTMKHTKLIAKLGGYGYDFIILLNRSINKFLKLIGKEQISFSKKIKNSVKKAVKFISDFELTIVQMAADNKYDMVACGHIHQPLIKDFEIDNKKIEYMNSGDWIENLTSLEFDGEKWKVFNYKVDFLDK